MSRRLILGCVVAMAAACGGSNPAPAPTPISIAGAWSGTWQFVTSGVTVTDNVHATFTQTDTATGNWTADSGATGQFTFRPASSVTGTMTIAQPRVSGGTCTATANLTGMVSANAMTLSVPTIPPSALCAWATNHQFSLHR
ncbi:MAG TPA: hypothetical protein VJN96_16440 [Vicinamibacterales bacterium]|nr:hypothetical protein [Vicinamibacterales bacterium]